MRRVDTTLKDLKRLIGNSKGVFDGVNCLGNCQVSNVTCNSAAKTQAKIALSVTRSLTLSQVMISIHRMP